MYTMEPPSLTILNLYPWMRRKKKRRRKKKKMRENMKKKRNKVTKVKFWIRYYKISLTETL